MTGQLDKRLAAYSKGMKQRLLLGSALLWDPKLLSRIKSELDTLAAYPEFLDKVQAKANQLSGISFFKTAAAPTTKRKSKKRRYLCGHE